MPDWTCDSVPKSSSHAGQCGQPLVAEHADVEFAPVDVLFHERVAARLVVDEFDALAQSRHVLDHGGLRDAERGVVGRRLDEQREAQSTRLPKALPDREQLEARRRDAMRGEHLLGEHLVARDHHAARVAAGIGLAHQLEVGDHVVVVGDDAVELLEQVEDDVRAPIAHGLAQFRQAVADADDAHLVAEVLQHGQHIVLGPAFLDRRLGQAREIGRRHQCFVHHQQDPAALHRA